MKQVILMIALTGSAYLGVNAQTNRTYSTGMQTDQIYENERRGKPVSTGIVKLNTGSDNQETKMYEDNLRMNSVQQFQGYRSNWNNSSVQRYFGSLPVNVTENFIGSGYDTSKNNGHCIGCGSGALTDHGWQRGKW